MAEANSQDCPVCGNPIPARVLRKRIGGFFSALSPRLGIECANCGSALKVDGRRTALVIAAAAVFFFVLAFAVRDPQRTGLSIWQMVGGIPPLLAYFYGSRLVSVRSSRPGEQLRFSDDPWENLDREVAPRRRKAEADASLEDERVAEISSPVRKPWACVACSAENPATFDLCWQCGRSHNDI